tara:strand:- start:14425 stop:16197 length:1773 start_codon:yes stop_codon:yes gene_type:complete
MTKKSDVEFVEPRTSGNSSAFAEMKKRLHFNPAEAMIWLDDRRMVLMQVEALGLLRQELIESIGREAARGLLTRFGYSSGCRDAEVAVKINQQASPVDLLISGGDFHALQGVVAVELVHQEIDIEKGTCNIEFLWKNCFEDQVHTHYYGISSEVACWIETGYASGFLSTCMGKRILVKEVECRAQGKDVCRCIARPLDEWADIDEARYIYPDITLPEAGISKVLTAVTMPSDVTTAGTEVRAGMLGVSAPFNVLMHKIKRVAATNATVLLQGESGVGKSVFARELVRLSKRAGQPFLEMNCAAIPDQLIESELFGVVKGAYTGANNSRPGRFDMADGGTLFLDEVGTLSLIAQGKLLRVIQDGEFEPLGSVETHKVNVRIIAATNEDLKARVREGSFREDLFYRLNVFPILVPPLRNRRDDIPLLLEFFMKKFSDLYEKHPSGITARALQTILNYSWPGNIREFENVIERGIILCDTDQPLAFSHLFTIDTFAADDTIMAPDEFGLLSEINLQDKSGDAASQEEKAMEEMMLSNWSDSVVQRSRVTLEDVEDALIRSAIKACDGNLTQAAIKLGLTRSQIAYKAKKKKMG